MRDAVLDLFLGSTCAVCEAPGRPLCAPCRAMLPVRARTCWPTPCPAGLARPVAAGEYDGALKALVLAHKERQRFALARPLGALLATAVLDLVEGETVRSTEPAPARWLLVPVPSRGTVVRGRGHDPVLRMTRQAAGSLRGQGIEAGVAGLLRSTGAALDQAGLGAEARATNLARTMRCAAARSSPRLARLRTTARLVVVDDVLTTGSTAREAQRALAAADLEVTGIATVAATRRRITRRDSPASLPFWESGD